MRLSEPDLAATGDYANRRERHLEEQAAHRARARRISIWRLGVAAAAIAWIVAAWRLPAMSAVELPVLAVLVAIFAWLVRLSGRERERIRVLGALALVNEENGHRVARRWDRLPLLTPSGPPDEHPFARDLDLFGRMSLFQLLGTTATAPGRVTLRDWLITPAAPDEIPRRQEAARELAALVDVREALAARGRLAGPVAIEEVERFASWAEGEPWLVGHPALRAASWAIPGSLVALALLGWVGVLPGTLWVLPLAASVTLSALRGARVRETLDAAFARETPVRHYGPVLEIIERIDARAALLRELRTRLGEGDGAAHHELTRLGRIADLAHVRWSPMLYLTLQAVTLWDFHVLAMLERWQRRAGSRAREWLAALGEVEALAALAALSHDNPDWAFPVEAPADRPVVDAEALGHPLLPDGVRVPNDVRVGPPGTFLLVTGSNMSGKSTLLRAIGLNVVLAQCGGPVCASAMRVPPVRLETSMRIEDSLALGLSHFMAELTRLKGVVEAARDAREGGDRTLLYLIDEMLQGTNSSERQVAARRIVGFLLENGAIGAVTTHDLALAETPELAESAVPVHFRETVGSGPDEPAMTFDYRLRPGVATSVNALRLMGLIGLG
ncbi:MAG TPA: hypothetical protein VMM18_02400 [Gemmatimonadaceae bacterium]|nr:hypothetical protein [Gemmatimonadaceae bacterium]